jgi:hypothetical protein
MVATFRVVAFLTWGRFLGFSIGNDGSTGLGLIFKHSSN